MNPSKKDSNNWILCASKRFPGLFYYFNIVTREAIWNRNDMQKRLHTNVLPDKWNNMYPEPDGPPDLPSSHHFGSPINRNFGQVPCFGQATFPPQNTLFRPAMTVSPYEPGQTWSGLANYGQRPFQYERRRENLFMDSKFYEPPGRFEQQMPQNVRQYHNQNGLNTRTLFDSEKLKEPSFLNYRSVQEIQCNPNSFRPDHETHSFNPFQPTTYSYNGQVFSAKPRNFSKQEPKNISFENPFRTKILGQNASKPDFVSFGRSLSKPERKTCDCMSKTQEELSRFNTEAHNYQIQKNIDRSRLFARSKSADNLNAATQTVVEKNPFRSPSKLTASKSFENLVKATQSPKKQVVESHSKETDIKKDTSKDSIIVKDDGLPETDLRYLLMARRRRFAGKSDEGPSELKRIKTSYPKDKKSESPKKKVTFDLGVEEYSVTEDEPNCDEILPDTTENAVMDTEADANAELCYVIVDTEVLLAEYQLIEKLVQSDKSYCLLIPQVVKREVEALSVGLCNGRLQVVHARQVLRKLAEPPEYLIEEPVDAEGASAYVEFTDEPILMYCLQVLDEGYSVVLVTNNKELQSKATALEIYCYSTESVKEILDTTQPEVSFDLKKIDNNNTDTSNTFNSETVTDIPVKCTRRQLFGDTSADENQNEKEKFFRENLNTDIIITTEINREIEKLKLDSPNNQTKIDFNNRLKELAGKQLKTNFTFKNDEPTMNFKITAGSSIFKSNEGELNGGESLSSKFKSSGDSSIFLEKGCQVMEVTSTANKKKNKNINTYNLNEHLKRYHVKNSFVEERIVTRLDEWLCSFSQIMEVTLLDTLKSISIPLPSLEDAQLSISALIECVGECFEHRIVGTLAKLLSASLGACYATSQCSGSQNSGRVCMKPSEFMKMLGYGTLLIKCLRGILPGSTELEEGETLLKQLLHNIEDVNTDIEPTTPVCKPANTTQETTRTQHFVKKPTEVLEYLKKHFPHWKYCDNSNNDSSTPQETSKGKIVRTSGKKIGQVKINIDKTIILTDDKNGDIKKQDKLKKHEDNVKETLTGAKLMKKLVNESTNLPPKMKDIDIEKREAVNKEMLNMIENILDNEKQMGNILDDVEKNVNILNVPNGTKFTRIFDKTTEKICKKITEITKADNLNEVKKPLDLDVLDYSDIETSDTLVLEPINTDKSLTNDSSKTDDGMKTNDNSQANINPLFDESSNTVDSGFHEGTVYTFIKHFLAKLTQTFKDIHEYMYSIVNKIQQDNNSDIKEVWQVSTEILRGCIELVINQLKLIKERDNSSTLSPTLSSACDAAANDLRIRTYRQITKKLLTQARLLRDSLSLLRQTIMKEFHELSVSSESDC